MASDKRRHGPDRCEACDMRDRTRQATRLFQALVNNDVDITMTEFLSVAEDTFLVRFQYRLVER